MTRSKFRLWTILPVTMTFLASGLLYVILSNITVSSVDNLPTAVYVFTILFLFIWIWLIFGELRTKTIVVKIEDHSITTTNFLGLGITRQFEINEFDGFTTSLLPSRGGTYEYLYLIKDNKKIIKLSEFYHENYFELKNVITKKIKFMGNKPFNLFTEIKEIFQ